ncbi:tyrosine-type recombinase/integrase [Martelella alba]|nr:tyrosine-type recombinase/integrase [Martelella alba]
MPKGVFLRASGYYWKPGGSTQKIAPPTATKGEVWLAYEKQVAAKNTRLTFKQLWDKFINSPDFANLAIRTQRDYAAHATHLHKVFGAAAVDDIKPELVRRYMDARGKKSTVQANHEHSSMSRVYRWGYQRGYVKMNPCTGVDKFPKPQRDRYITDEEYAAIYDVAPTALRVAMEIAYLCAARVSDVIKMTWDQVMEQGIYIQQGKTGVKQIKSWTDRLREAIALAKTLHGKNNRVIKSVTGLPYSYNGFNDVWSKARRGAGEKLGYVLDCTFHDLKAKGISDYEGSSRDKQLFSGHKTESQILVYDRRVKVTPTLNKKRI